MMPTSQQLWDRFKTFYSEFPAIGLSIDLSRMNFPDDLFSSMEPRLQRAFVAMSAAKAGAASALNATHATNIFLMILPT